MASGYASWLALHRACRQGTAKRLIQGCSVCWGWSLLKLYNHLKYITLFYLKKLWPFVFPQWTTWWLTWQAGWVSSLIPCTVTRCSKVSNRSTSDWESEWQMLFLAGNLVYIHMKYSLNFFVGLTQDHTQKNMQQQQTKPLSTRRVSKRTLQWFCICFRQTFPWFNTEKLDNIWASVRNISLTVLRTRPHRERKTMEFLNSFQLY